MSPLDQWFANEILPHEASLVRYLRRVWRDQAEVPDLRQEIYVRVYENAGRTPRSLPTLAKAKSLLFVTARHLITDLIRRERIVSIDYSQDLEALNVLIDEISPEHRLSARQELRQLSEALDRLSDNCRAVVWLRRVEGLSQKDAAERLGMNEGALEGYMVRGLRALTKAVFADPAQGEARKESRGSEYEGEHG